MDIIGSEDKFILQHSGEIVIPPSFPRLYGPIIGSKALGVYLSLSSIPSSMAPHEASELLRSCWSTLAELQGSLTLLEGIGLVDSYKDGKAGVYCLLMNPPLPAESFLSSELLSRQLSNSLGEEDFKSLKAELLGNRLPLDTFTRIGAKFEDIYGLFPKRKLVKPRVVFDRSKFEQAFFSSSGFQAKSLSEDEIKKISLLSSFYSVDDEVTGQVAAESFSPFGKMGNRINFETFEQSLSRLSKGLPYLHRKAEKSPVGKGNHSSKADTIRLLDSISPTEFLSNVQGGGAISKADQALAHKVAVEMGLPFPATNGLLSFALDKFHNTLPPKYVETMAGVLLRNRISTSRDAIEFLTSYEMENRKRKEEKDAKSGSYRRYGKMDDNQDANLDDDEPQPTQTKTKEELKKQMDEVIRRIYGSDSK